MCWCCWCYCCWCYCCWYCYCWLNTFVGHIHTHIYTYARLRWLSGKCLHVFVGFRLTKLLLVLLFFFPCCKHALKSRFNCWNFSVLKFFMYRNRKYSAKLMRFKIEGIVLFCAACCCCCCYCVIHI